MKQKGIVVERVLSLDLTGLDHRMEGECLEILVPESVPLPYQLFEGIEGWAVEYGLSRREAGELRERVGEEMVRALDERFVLHLMR